MNKFYALPLGSVVIIITFSILIWAGIEQLGKENKRFGKWWRYVVNIILCIVSIFLIIRMTLLGRTVGQQEIELMPFHTFTTMAYNNEAARMLLMNVVLFLPFGLTIPYVLEGVKENRRRWIYCILIGCGISVGIEALQYCLGMGLAETDDVICNTVGCGLVILADVIGRRKLKEI